MFKLKFYHIGNCLILAVWVSVSALAYQEKSKLGDLKLTAN